MTLAELTTTVRSLLNNPAQAEISDIQIGICWRRALDKYSRYKPIKSYYYDVGYILVADQLGYDLPDETFHIVACRIYDTLAGLVADIDKFEQYQKDNPGYTGYGDFEWIMNNNKLELTSMPAMEDAGKFIGLLLYKSHVFTAGSCTTISRSEFEGQLLNWCKGDVLEEWAGYAGDISYGSARESRENIRKEGQRLKAEAEKVWATGLV